MKTRLLIFAVLAPVISFALLLAVTLAASLAQGAPLEHLVRAPPRMLGILSEPGGVIICVISAVSGVIAGAISRFMDPGQPPGARVLAALGALLFVSPINFIGSLVVISPLPMGLLAALFVNGLALAGSWWLARANDGLRLRPVAAVFD